MNPKYPNLLSPAKIGNVELRNKTVMAAMGMSQSTDGFVNTADLVEALNAKKGTPSTRFIQYNADQTGNGVDANDIKAIVEKIMK